MNPTVPTIHHALLAAQQELPTVVGRDHKGRFGQYMTLEHLIDTVRPILTKHGITLHTQIVPEEGALFADTILTHAESGTKLESRWPLHRAEANPGSLHIEQQYGRSLTYARRYCLLALLGIGMGDPDPDAQPPPPPVQTTSTSNGHPGPAVPPEKDHTRPNSHQFHQFNQRLKSEIERLGNKTVDRIMIETETNKPYEKLTLGNMRAALKQMAAQKKEVDKEDLEAPLN